MTTPTGLPASLGRTAPAPPRRTPQPTRSPRSSRKRVRQPWQSSPIPTPRNSYVATKQQQVGTTARDITYSYDKLGRLTKSTGNALTSTYTYDAVGNRTQWTAPDDPTTAKPSEPFVQDNTYNFAGQLTKSIKSRHNGGATFTDTTLNTWDDNGNLALAKTVAQAPGQSSSQAFAYDTENRLTAAGPANKTGGVCGRPGIGNDGCPPGLNKNPKPGNSGKNPDKNTLLRTYDSLGRLVTETNAKTVTTWTHDGLDPIYAVENGPGSGANDTTSTYLRDGFGDLLGEKAGKKDTVTWYATDALRSIYAGTDARGGLMKSTTDYSDYGVQLEDTAWNFGYTGERADATANGLVGFYARSYQPSVASWLQIDAYRGNPAQPRSLASYVYVWNMPTSARDFAGAILWFIAPIIIVGATAIAALAPKTAYAPAKPGSKNDLPHLSAETAKKKPQGLGDFVADTLPGVYAGKCALGVYADCNTFDVGLSATLGAGTAWRIGSRANAAYNAMRASQRAQTSLRLGVEGEEAVRSAYSIGPKATRVVDGRTRIFDGLSDGAVSEVKNVKYQSYDQQLMDSAKYAATQNPPLRFDLYVRSDTILSGPLQAAVMRGEVKLKYIP